MQEEAFYNLPADSKIEQIKFIKNKGFTALDKNENELFVIYMYDNGPDYESEGLIRIIDNNKIGFANLQGDIEIPAAFDAALPFNDKLTAVCKGCSIKQVEEHSELVGGTWGFINKSGQLVIPYRYEKVIQNFSNGIAKVELNKSVIRINKTADEIVGEKMNYKAWINVFEKVTNLISKLYLNDNYAVKNSYAKNADYLFVDKNVSYLKCALNSRDKKIIEYDFIPWTDFSLNHNKDDFASPLLTNEFVIVTEYAVVYKSFQASDLTSEELSVAEEFDTILHDVLDYNALYQLQEEELNFPENIQVISTKVYNYFVDLQITIPGSKLPEADKWKTICKNRMLHLHLVPDIGEVISNWIITQPDVLNVYYTSVEDSLLAIFNESLDLALSSNNSSDEIYLDGKEKIRALFNASNSYVNVLYDRYEKRLQRWLLLDKEMIVFPSEDNIFGDYEQKRTPDTLLDYAPQLSEEFKKIPLAQTNNLSELINLFNRYQLEAENNPGQWEDGNMVLGARPKEYKPSPEELILNEIGNRIKYIVSQTPKPEVEFEREINYKNFAITHVDVMGSGRFFYIDEIEDITITLAR